MKLTIEIDNQVLVDCLNSAHSRYWAMTDTLDVQIHNDTVIGRVRESESDSGYSKLHNLDVNLGLQRLAKYAPEMFGRVISGDSDGPDADVFLQLCAGLMYNDGPKYG